MVENEIREFWCCINVLFDVFIIEFAIPSALERREESRGGSPDVGEILECRTRPIERSLASLNRDTVDPSRE